MLIGSTSKYIRNRSNFLCEDYRYSGAIDYMDEKGVLDYIVVFKFLIYSPKNHTKKILEEWEIIAD
ncbi:hypothetical protein C1634_024885 [Chryseobacterium viscerum]|uniref:Uncharacterized protein n=1 Tax=Chryseobacterium viscerum TaxID=1037377 RepID=A0A316WA17_9FLAO|nr:hypothetical protein C1634_024885 [Chryseobacterium viscerum]